MRKGPPASQLGHALDVHPTADGTINLSGIGFEIVNNLILGRERIRADVGKCHARETVVPGRSIGDQRIPPLRPPALGDPVPLQNKVGNTPCCRDARSGPTRPDHHPTISVSIFFRCHVRPLFRRSARPGLARVPRFGDAVFAACRHRLIARRAPQCHCKINVSG